MKRRFGCFLIIALMSCSGLADDGAHQFTADGDTHYCMNEMHREKGVNLVCAATHKNGAGKTYGCTLGDCGNSEEKEEQQEEEPINQTSDEEEEINTVHEHKFEYFKTVLPTYGSAGYTLKQCSCGETEKTNFVPPSLWTLYGGKKSGDNYLLAEGTGNRIYMAGSPAIENGYVDYTIKLPGGETLTGTANVGDNGEAVLLSGDDIAEGEYVIEATLHITEANSKEREYKVTYTISIVKDNTTASSLTFAAEQEDAPEETPEEAQIVVATAYPWSTVNLRAGPTTDAVSVAKLKPGDKVQVFSEDSQFYKVGTSDGEIGYISKDYLVETTTVADSFDGCVKLTDSEGNALVDKPVCVSVWTGEKSELLELKTNESGEVTVPFGGDVSAISVSFEGDETNKASRVYISNEPEIMPKGDNWVFNETTGTFTYTREGEMVTGWLQENGKQYYFDPSGEMVTGWFQDGGNDWYYANKYGEIGKNTWIRSDDGAEWSFVNENGAWVY